MSEYPPELREEFRDKDYRYAYAEDFLNTFVATQIRVLREERNLKQEDLAQLIGTKQSGISRLENVNYSAWKTDTLRKIAKALGVRLRISFETFGTLLDDSARFSSENLERPEFEDDPVFQEEQIAESEPSIDQVSIAKMLEQRPIQNLASIKGFENKKRGELVFFQKPKQTDLGEAANASLGRHVG